MDRTLTGVIWIGILSTFVFGSHYYLWLRLVRDTSLSAQPKLLSTAILISLAVCMLAGPFIAHQYPQGIGLWGMRFAYSWLGVVFFLLMLFWFKDALHFIYFLLKKFSLITSGDLEPNRRLFLQRIMHGSMALGGLGVGALALKKRQELYLKEVDVKLSRFPKALNGFRLVQWTDVHVGIDTVDDYIADLVVQTNALKPDLVAITGDLIDADVSILAPKLAALKKIESRFGVYFVTGNHEYYHGADAWLAELGRLGVRVLRNEAVEIGTAPGSFMLAGVDDAGAHRLARGHGADFEKACGQCDKDKEIVLLAHQPKAIYQAQKYPVGLQISGHTHGGQIWPFNFFVRLAQPFVRGLHAYKEMQIYVSSGTGTWGPPMRLGTQCEITSLKLFRA